LHYIDFLKHFIWKNNNWQQRKRGSEKVILWLYMCSLRNKKRFYLKLLLIRICRAISYKAIHTINKILYNTFEEIVWQLELLDKEIMNLINVLKKL